MATLTQNVTTIVETFEDIKDAIETKGGTVSGGVGNYAASILAIPQSGGGGVIDASTDWSYMFANNKRLSLLSDPDLATSHVEDMSYLCYKSTSLTTMSHPLNMNACTDASHMFEDCNYLTNINLTNTNNITDISYMFDDCTRLVFPSTMNFVSCTNADYAFQFVGSGVLNIKFSSQTRGTRTFYNSRFTEIHILSDTIFTNPSNMFYASSLLETVTGINFSGITGNFGTLFRSCPALETLEFAENSTIDFNGFDIRDSTSLTTQSIWNILDALNTTTSSKTCTLPTGKMPSISDLTARYGSDFDTATNKLKGWTLSPTPA